MNNMLRPRLNWKNLCIIFSIIFFIIGFNIGKVFASGINNAGIITGNGPETIIYNVDNNPIINPNYNIEQSNSNNFQFNGNLKPATPFIPNNNLPETVIITGYAQLTDGGTVVIPNSLYQILPQSYYNLVITYNSPVQCLAVFTIQYDLNGVKQTKEIVQPINAGFQTITLYNWMIKNSYNSLGTPVNFDIQNLVCINVRPVVSK